MKNYYYPLEVQSVYYFARFLRSCGIIELFSRCSLPLRFVYGCIKKKSIYSYIRGKSNFIFTRFNVIK